MVLFCSILSHLIKRNGGHDLLTEFHDENWVRLIFTSRFRKSWVSFFTVSPWAVTSFCMFQLPHSPVGRVLWGVHDSSCRAHLSWCLACGRTRCMLVIPVIHTMNVFSLPSLHYIEHNWLRVFTTLLRNVLKLQIKSYSCQSAIWEHFQKMLCLTGVMLLQQSCEGWHNSLVFQLSWLFHKRSNFKEVIR